MAFAAEIAYGKEGRGFKSSFLFFDARQIGGVKRNKQMLHNSLFGDLRNKTSFCSLLMWIARSFSSRDLGNKGDQND